MLALELDNCAISFITVFRSPANLAFTLWLQLGVQCALAVFARVFSARIGHIAFGAHKALFTLTRVVGRVDFVVDAGALAAGFLRAARFQVTDFAVEARSARTSRYVLVLELQVAGGLVLAWVGITAVLELALEKEAVDEHGTTCAQY